MQEREGIDDIELYPYSSIYAVPDVTSTVKPLSISSENIKKIKHLGNGNFGQVVLAHCWFWFRKYLGGIYKYIVKLFLTQTVPHKPHTV